MENQASNNYFTSDIQIASYLMSKGISFLGVDRPPEAKKAIFVFEQVGDKINKLIQDYFSDKATVNPRVLFASFSNLKSVIFREIRY